jgi:hypothetical protein
MTVNKVQWGTGVSHLHKNEKCSPFYYCVGAMILLMQEEEAERRKKQVSISFH